MKHHTLLSKQCALFLSGLKQVSKSPLIILGSKLSIKTYILLVVFHKCGHAIISVSNKQLSQEDIMTPSRIIPSVIQHDVECYACRGNRYVMANHSLGMLIAIMDDENGPEYKINFIICYVH